MSKHTLGPWKVEKESDYLVIDSVEPFPSVCILSGPNQEANAHLIAAAPGLLECLDLANKTLQVFGMTVDLQEDARTNLNKLVETCSMAIAKARGEQ